MNNVLDLHQKLQASSQCYCKSFYLQASQFREKTTPTEMVPHCQHMKDLFSILSSLSKISYCSMEEKKKITSRLVFSESLGINKLHVSGESLNPMLYLWCLQQILSNVRIQHITSGERAWHSGHIKYWLVSGMKVHNTYTCVHTPAFIFHKMITVCN